MSSEKQLVVQKLEKLAFEGPVYARAGFKRLWNQVTGYGIPREIEGFQASPADQARDMLSTFFGLWNSFPVGFTKATDISEIINTTWTGYVNASATNHIGANFGSLLNYANVSSVTISIRYTNTARNTSMTVTGNVNNAIYVRASDISINPYIPERYTCPAGQSYSCNASVCGGSVNYCGCFSPTNCSTPSGGTYPSLVDSGTRPTYNAPIVGTGSTNITFTFDAQPFIDTITNFNCLVSISDLSGTYVKSYNNQRLVIEFNPSYNKLTYDFNNIYTALLIDLYTSINGLHSTSPPVPYTSPTFTTAINTTTDRANAMAGTNTDTIKNSYLTNYLPNLYSSVYNQVNSMMTNIERIWSLFDASTKSLLFSTLTSVNEDIQKFKDLPATSVVDNVITNLILTTNLYNIYSSSYASMIAEETNIAVYSALQKFFTIYNGDLPTGFSASSIVRNITSRWNTIIDRTAISNKYKGTDYSQLSEGSCSSAYSFTATYSNNTDNRSITFNNIKINDEIVLSDISASINSRTVSYSPCPSTAQYSSSSGTYTGSYNTDLTPWGGPPQCLYVYTIRPGEQGNFTVPKQSSSTPGTGTFTVTINAPNANVCIYNITASYNVLSSLTINGVSHGSPLTLFIKNKETLKYDLNNSHAKLLIEIYDFIKTRHSYLPPISWSPPLTSPTNIQADLQNAFNVIDTYTSTYLPSLYTSVYNQTDTLINNLQGVSSSTLAADTATIANFTSTANENTLLSDLITISNIYNRYSSSYDGLIGGVTRSKLSDFYNNSYKPGARYLKSTDMALTVAYASGTLTLQQVATKCASYMNADGSVKTTLQSGDTSWSNLLILINAANTKFVTALIDRFYNVHTDWTGNKGLTALTGLPTDQGAADKAALDTNFDTTRTTYLGNTRWSNLMSVIKEHTRTMLNSAKVFETWKTTAKGTSVTQTGIPQTTGLDNLV